MGKSGCKWKESVSMETVIQAINISPINSLLPIAKVVCGSDYSVRYYNNKNHPIFYHNDEGVRKALRRCLSIGAFNHRETIIRMLDFDVEYVADNE